LKNKKLNKVFLFNKKVKKKKTKDCKEQTTCDNEGKPESRED